MSGLASTKLQRLAQVTDAQSRAFAGIEGKNHRLAFWHDVGVTGLGALATILLGVAEIARVSDAGRLFRVVVLFLTGSVTVFAACDQFFKFKTTAQIYRTAGGRLRSLQRALDRLSEQPEPNPNDLAQAEGELEAILNSVDPAEPERSIWGSGIARRSLIAFIILVVFGSITVSLLVVHCHQ